MISKLHIQGFKCFDNADFTITPLTLLAGLNSSGKSTLLQAIRLVLRYNSDSFAGLGPLSELVSTLHNKFRITMTSDGGETVFEHPESMHHNQEYVQHGLVSYISAARLGPELHLPIRETTKRGQNVGVKGEYVIDFLEYHSELAGLPEILRRPETKSSAVRNNVSAWLSIISPGVDFEWESIPKADLLRAEFSGRRPGNVGFGISYTLPIIANVLGCAALVAKGEEKSALIMLENPEAHLHPAGQTRLGGFLAKAASCGVQVIVETHSDHLLNGIRLAVKDKFLDAKDSTYYYFSYDFDEEKSVVKQPVIDEDGYFDEWPDGFFDETEKNLERFLQ